MRRLLLLLLCVPCVAGLLVLPSSSSARAAARTTISGGNLPFAVALSPLDEQAFFQRIGPLPKLDDEPSTTGKSYTVTSPYWDIALRGDDKDAKPAEADAQYFPDGGYVLAKQGGEDAWVVIDLRQRAVLDRYIRFSSEGAPSLSTTEPGTIDVMRIASARGEEIGIEAG